MSRSTTGWYSNCAQPGVLEDEGLVWQAAEQRKGDGLARRLRFIEQFDFASYLPRGYREDGDRNLIVRETKRFFQVVAHGISCSIASRKVDDVWHEMVLDSIGYHRFCINAFGGYLHHIPAGRSYDGPDELQRFRQIYQQSFREDLPGAVWDLKLLDLAA